MDTLFINTDGGRIAYDDQGSGSLVICVPGMGDVRGEYRFLAPSLVKAGYRVVTMDVRGHGESSVSWNDYTVAGIGEDIRALIRHIGAGPATVIGTSMAAGAAVVAAADSPELVTGIVLIGPFVSDTMPHWQRPIMNSMFSLLFAAPWGASAWARYYAGLYPTRKPADFDAYQAKLKTMLSDGHRLAALRAMLVASKTASEQRLSRVKAPALVIMGSKDPDFKDTQAMAESVAARVHGSTAMVDGAGHYPHAEMPEQTSALIMGFLLSIPEKAYVA